MQSVRLWASFTLALIVAVTMVSPVWAVPTCPSTTKQKLAMARAVLSEPQEPLMAQRDRDALYCLLDVVAELEAKMTVTTAPASANAVAPVTPPALTTATPPTEEAD